MSRRSRKITAISANLFLVAIIGVFIAFFSIGNIVPDAISERLIEATDIQYADAVESKKLVFAEALRNGTIPADTAAILAKNGVTVNGTHLEYNGQTITADNFTTAVSNDAKLYAAFTAATYGRAAYYYDDAATKVFRQIGTNRNNYTSESDFDDVMTDKVGTGSNVSINTVAKVKKTRTNSKTGQTETYYEYIKTGADATSKSAASDLISNVATKNTAADTTTATLNTADALKVADTVSKEQRSSLFFLTFMENISKMKAGDGNESKINDAMNYLYESKTSTITDINTGDTVTATGTPLESPSLYAILSGDSVKPQDVANYSSDRILLTAENQLGTTSADISGTVASTTSGVKTSIGRFITSLFARASSAITDLFTPTIESSLINNSYDTIEGVAAGELLAEGATNVGKALAIQGSGATSGDRTAVLAYQKATTKALALDAAADRLTHSPFDITNKNTFLGSLVRKIATTIKPTTFTTTLTTLSTLTNTSLISLLPTTAADDATNTFLSTTGNCPTLASIGAAGSVHCSAIATFDTTTLNNTFSDPGFVNFVNQNTTLKNGVRTINPGSTLANFILYNNERTTPIGITDGSILKSLQNSSASTSFLGDILDMIKTWLGSSDTNKAIASGAVFVNSANNPAWQTYKYAQRYVSLARATATLNQYTDDQTAYTTIPFFEGPENPVVAFLATTLATR